jgi:hypothetical protein
MDYDRTYFRIVMSGAITALVAIPLFGQFHGLAGAATLWLSHQSRGAGGALLGSEQVASPAIMSPAALLLALTVAPLLLDARQVGNPNVVTLLFNCFVRST